MSKMRTGKSSKLGFAIYAVNPGRRHTVVLMLVAFLIAFLVSASQGAYAENERESGYYTLTDEGGRVLFRTALQLSIGDIFIDSDNRAYEVREISGDNVRARFLEVVKLIDSIDSADSTSSTGISPPPIIEGEAGGGLRGRGAIAIYHSHSDESYQPTSGTSSKKWGDIYEVGKALAARLRQKGYEVILSEANHNPHDGAAYERSRRTAVSLLKRQPVAIFDVHRDAVPPEEYNARVSGEDVTKVTLIVGRQNQTRGTNIKFAKTLKAAADRQHPGLVKGILLAQGNYNQDLFPRAMLLEFGASTNTLDRAIRSAELFADSITLALTTSGVAESRPSIRGGGTARSALWMIGVVVAGAVLFILLNEGSRHQLRKRLSRLRGSEFLNLFGLRRRK
ncbi:MAG TPA: stage II sporulation protein P [Firmicutes bacterium]|nr:stage II sporulation protein P [Bacillota bacterium]